MKSNPLLFVMLALWVAGCGQIPYRSDGFAASPECVELHNAYDDISGRNKSVPEAVAASRCWLSAREERSDYDLLFLEFDDQGWVQGSFDLSRPSPDHLDAFIAQLKQIYNDNRRNGLSLVVFIHGWHHNAEATDSNVTEFRWLVRDLAIAEKGRKSGEEVTAGTGPRVVGIYVGWRGESVTVPLLKELTFWERKSTAERVAQGSVRELFARLDFLRDRGRTDVAFDSLSAKDRPKDGKRNVRMLTIGHSFGGLIVYEALSSEFVRAAARSTGEDYVSRLGDLVVIVNPAIEGARYEPLMAAGQRITGFKKDQLPVVIVATSTADWATRVLFPAARFFSTFLERTPGAEDDAIVYAVGHNARYTTHLLGLCGEHDAACPDACPVPQVKTRQSTPDNRTKLEQDISAEYRLMSRIGKAGFRKTEYLCSGLQLEGTKNQTPPGNPFWVVSTTKHLMKDHSDIFNPRFVSFVRQMYLGVIAERFKGD